VAVHSIRWVTVGLTVLSFIGILANADEVSERNRLEDCWYEHKALQVKKHNWSINESIRNSSIYATGYRQNPYSNDVHLKQKRCNEIETGFSSRYPLSVYFKKKQLERQKIVYDKMRLRKIAEDREAQRKIIRQKNRATMEQERKERERRKKEKAKQWRETEKLWE